MILLTRKSTRDKSNHNHPWNQGWGLIINQEKGQRQFLGNYLHNIGSNINNTGVRNQQDPNHSM